MRNNNGAPSAIYTVPPMSQTQSHMVPIPPTQHTPVGIGPMMPNFINQWTPSPSGFCKYNNTQGDRGFGSVQGGQRYGCGNRAENNTFGWYGRAPGFGIPLDNNPNPFKCYYNWCY